eukprot:TRINITY_DN41120_c0_g1_i1.p1 TRINITY_DN41120_c0_g1~~TRINITY_DN41120_c0_g1_i1.p1  ORF type:complete len:424 (-),score=40.57 TRINITY_DN41120_c0_g1_i1:348-1571(-)
MQGYSPMNGRALPIARTDNLESPTSLERLSRGVFKSIATACGVPTTCCLEVVASWARTRLDEDGGAIWGRLLEAHFHCKEARPEGMPWKEFIATEWRIMTGWNLWAVLRRADCRSAVQRCVGWLSEGSASDVGIQATYENVMFTLMSIPRPSGRTFLQVAGENPFRLSIRPTSEAWPDEDPHKPFEIQTICPGLEYSLAFNLYSKEMSMFTEMAFERRLGKGLRWFEVGAFRFPRLVDETVLLGCILWEATFHGTAEPEETCSGLDCWKKEFFGGPLTPRTAARIARKKQREQKANLAAEKAAKMSAATNRKAEKRALLLQRMNSREMTQLEKRSQRVNDRELAREALRAEYTERHRNNVAEIGSSESEEDEPPVYEAWGGGYSIRSTDGVLVLDGADPNWPPVGKD